MIVYREQSRTIATCDAIAAIREKFAAYDPQSIRELLIEFGRLECGIADALPPRHSSVREFRRIALHLGRKFYRSIKGRPIHAFTTPFERLGELPETIEIREPEGYAFYGLFPEAYLAAVEDFFREAQPREAMVIGIRSIGTSLSAAVAGALAEFGARVASWTVRPRGHPFNRVAELPAIPLTGAPYLVVDEGPGLSGSSFASVAEALAAAGVPDSQIIFFSSWRPDAAVLRSEKGRERWQRHRAFCGAFLPSRLHGWKDVSAGEWRPLVFSSESEFPAVQPQHERRKFLSVAGPPVLAKFAGFGERGRAALERSRRLHDAGFVPPPVGLAEAFLFTSFVAGRPVSKMSPQLLTTIARYLAHIQREFPSRASLSRGSLEEVLQMTAVNVSEALGVNWLPERRMVETLENSRPCLLDGRMLPHEWIETASGFLKTDAVDHGDDHFFPGPRDIAWDLAAVAIEFSLDDPTPLLDAYARLSGDCSVPRRFPFYALAYSAFRLGYCRLAQSSVGSPERDRFARAAERYLAHLNF